MTKSESPLAAYKTRIDRGELRGDPAQEKAVAALDTVYNRLTARPEKKGLIARVTKRGGKQAVKGLYLYGGVGRGKSMLMDLFAHALGDDIPHRRIHFHAFMLETHAGLKALREKWARDGEGELLETLAKDIAKKLDVLCFDEFHVTDIADAMILGPLFKALFAQGVCVIATSNWAPKDLYKDGLQRQRFLPFIDTLKANMDVLEVDGGTDYRMRALSENGVYFFPLADPVRVRVEALFETLTGHNPVMPETMNVGGRGLHIARAGEGVAYIEFDELCKKPRGASDYLELARQYHTVFIDNVPALDDGRRDWAKRFMTLIDALYDERVQVVITAAAPPENLYTGDELAFEFARTVSRLIEMQSPAWFARKDFAQNGEKARMAP